MPPFDPPLSPRCPQPYPRSSQPGRYNLCSGSPHTSLQQTAILLGSDPPKLFRKHDKAWTHSTSTTCTQIIYSFQSHFLKHQPSASPRPVPSPPFSLASPSSEDTQCQVCQSLFDEDKMLLCDKCNARWHMDCLIPPLTTIPTGMWKCPLCTPPAPSSQGPLRHLRCPFPSLTVVNHRLGPKRNKGGEPPAPNYRFSPHNITLKLKTILSKLYSQKLPSPPCVTPRH